MEPLSGSRYPVGHGSCRHQISRSPRSGGDRGGGGQPSGRRFYPECLLRCAGRGGANPPGRRATRAIW
jgi:hypothetical protein